MTTLSWYSSINNNMLSDNPKYLIENYIVKHFFTFSQTLLSTGWKIVSNCLNWSATYKATFEIGEGISISYFVV